MSGLDYSIFFDQQEQEKAERRTLLTPYDIYRQSPWQ